VERLINAGLSNLGVINPQLVPSKQVHDEMQRIIHEQEDFTRRQVEACRDRLQEVACRLLEEEKMTGDEFRRILGETRPLTPELAAAIHMAVKAG